MAPTTPKLWAVVPAAGIGARMAAELPKQYLPLAGATILEQTVAVLLRVTGIARLVVAVAAEDTRWQTLPGLTEPRVQITQGGASRAESVLAGLRALPADDKDWVLVHDAARPCVTRGDIEKLVQEVGEHTVGGILGCPVRDTMKRVSAGSITATVAREQLWHALTPQLFRVGLLREALGAALAEGANITDEASALEWSGQSARMIAGRSDNLKITEPLDLALAEFTLQRQSAQGLR